MRPGAGIRFFWTCSPTELTAGVRAGASARARDRVGSRRQRLANILCLRRRPQPDPPRRHRRGLAESILEQRGYSAASRLGIRPGRQSCPIVRLWRGVCMYRSRDVHVRPRPETAACLARGAGGEVRLEAQETHQGKRRALSARALVSVCMAQRSETSARCKGLEAVPRFLPDFGPISGRIWPRWVDFGPTSTDAGLTSTSFERLLAGTDQIWPG